jgi:CheY-like chemotaxis protein
MEQPRVLIIEDNDALRVMLFTILRHQPLAVDTARSADEAIEKVLTCDYALILIDMDLPDGETFLRDFAEKRPEATSFVIAARSARRRLYRSAIGRGRAQQTARDRHARGSRTGVRVPRASSRGSAAVPVRRER